MRRARTISAGAVVMAGLLLAQAACGANDEGDGATAADHAGAAPEQANQALDGESGEAYEDYGVNPETATEDETRSTFALDVDTASYTHARGYLNDGFMPDPEMVRTEEFVNYFAQDYQPPEDGIGIHVDGTPVPFLDDPSKQVIRVGLQAAVTDDADRQPANLTFIVDVSGSMDGHNLEMVDAGLHQLLDSLNPDDAVAVATYDDEAELVLPMTPMTEEPAIRNAVDALRPGGSTNLEAGLQVGYEHAQANLRGDGINRVVLLSDGAANVGETDPSALADQIAQQADETTAAVIGVGRGTYDDVVLEQFADQGNGFYAYMDTTREAERLFEHDLTGTLQVVGRDAKVQVTFNPEAVTHFRLLGYENRQLEHDEFDDDSVDAGEVGAGHNVTALYEVTLPESGGDAELATVDVRWADPDTGETVDRSATITVGDLTGSFDQAPDRLRQSILVAAFAECLRDAPWSERVSLGQVADNAQVLSTVLAEDPDVAEFVEVTRTAADLVS